MLVSVLLLTLPFALAQSVYNPPNATVGTSATNGTSPNPQWATVLGNSLWFYEAQRSGKLPANNRVSWRNDSEVDDGSQVGLDLSGGYYDAGDVKYIKAMYPMTFSIFSIAWAGIVSGSGFDQTNQTGYLDSMLRWGLDWMIKMHPQENTLWVQVGSTTIDNAYWGGDQGIPSPRVCYQVNASAPGTDVAGSTSAAFALAALLYSNMSMNASSDLNVAYPLSSTSASLGNASYSRTLLTHARQLYTFANNTLPLVTYQTSVPDMAAAYGSSSFGDDLCVAALSLALATNESSYYADALGHYERFRLSGSQAVMNWDSKTPAAYLLFVQAAITRPSLAAGAGVANNLTGWQAEIERYFDQIVNLDMDAGKLTNGGLLYYEGDSNSASLNPALNAAVLMLRYASLASSQEKADTYEAFAQSQVNYVMGRNPMNSVYVVGSHPNSPQNPHSAMAAGGNDIGNIRNSPPVSAHVLYGAVVGGPLESDKFWDYRDDWVTNEIAIDYNAPLVALAAMMVEGSIDPYYTAVQAGTYSVPEGEPCDQALPCPTGGGLSEAAKIGIAVAVVVVVLALLLAFAWWKRDNIRHWWRSAGEKK